MKFKIHDYLSSTGVNEFKLWTEKLQTVERAKLREKIDKLARHGTELFPETLAGTSEAGIQKLRVRGKVQLRPMLCLGPVNVDSEFTMLLGAKEVGGKLVPNQAPATAKVNKAAVTTDPAKRRKDHERVS